MRWTARALALDGRESGIKLVIRQVYAEYLRKHRPILCLVLKHPSLGLAVCMPCVDTGIEHCDPRFFGSRPRRNDVAAIGALGMAGREPVANLVLSIDPRQRDHAIDVLPSIAELRLQR